MKKIIALFCLIASTFCYAESPKKLVVLLDWFANPNHAPLFVAKQQGFFKQQGLDVELVGPADPSDPPKLVAANQADIAITYQPQFMEQVDRGLPLISIGTLIDKPLNCLVTLKESHLQSISDFKGKTIGYSGNTNGANLKVMLQKNHLNPMQVHLINVHYDITQALLSKKIDAVSGMMRNFELIQLELAGHPGKAFFPEENGIPTYSELIFIVNSHHAKDPRWSQFLIALQKGVTYLQKHPDSSWQAFVKQHPELNDELNRRAWKATLPYFAAHPDYFDQNKWLAFAKFLQQNGLISKIQLLNMYNANSGSPPLKKEG